MWSGNVPQHSPPSNTTNQPGMAFLSGHNPIHKAVPQATPGPRQGQPPALYGSSDTYIAGRIPSYRGESPSRPPTGGQSYQATVTTPKGHEHYQPCYFQYSQCTLRKKALCIGINYTKTMAEPLYGCVDDAKNMRQFLIDEYGYSEDDVILLTDNQTDPERIPTRENMVYYFHWLVKDAKQDDSLFLHYSGHGGIVPDTDGDEVSGYDDVIFPMDFREKGHIVDDDLHDILVQGLPHGCRLTALFDSCHSGTVMDLPFVYNHYGTIKHRSRTLYTANAIRGVIRDLYHGDLQGAIKEAFKDKGEDARKRTLQMKGSTADVICWGSCKDEQTARETYEGGKLAGTLTNAFMAALRKDKKQSYHQLLVHIREIVLKDKPEYNQKPQLSSSHPMDMELLFIC
ncbi:Metacaspase-1 [Fomitopsis betulina]|nr:Metacaspase-1 [Fomitopsis betulina]